CKIVVIRPGKSSTTVSENDTLATVSPTDTQDLFDLARDVGENTRSITEDLRTIASRISKGQGVVGELLNDGGIAREIRTAVANMNATGANTARASQELSALISDLRSGSGLLPMLISDTSYTNTFREALANLEDVSRNASDVTKELDRLASNINRDDSPVGVLFTDSIAADQLKATIESAEQASRKLDENMEALQHNFLFRGYFRKK